MSQTPTTSSSESIRRAAVLVRSLPAEAAATLLGRLSPEEAASLRASIAALGDVDAEERAVVADAMRSAGQVEAEPVGVELDLSVSAPRDTGEAAAPPEAGDLFAALRDAEPGAIASYLSGEQPRAVALVLSYLPAEAASAVLESFSDERQGELLARMSRLGEADSESVRVIASDLAVWVERQRAEQRLRADRLATVRDLIDAASPANRERLLRRLAEADPASAETLGFAAKATTDEPKADDARVAAPPAEETVPSPEPVAPARAPAIDFEDLQRVDGRTLVEALSRLGSRGALLALAGASEPLLRRVESAVPRSAGREMRKRIAAMGRATLAEIAAAQRQWTEEVERAVVARRLRRAAAMN